MNKPRIDKLIKLFESLRPELLDMDFWPHFDADTDSDDPLDCGTPACVGGWCERLAASEGVYAGNFNAHSIAEYLDISHEQASTLAFPCRENNNEGLEYENDEEFNIPMAVRALRNIRDGCEARETWNGCSDLREE